MARPPRSPRIRPRHDAAIRVSGRARHATPQQPALVAACEAAVGKTAIFDGAGRRGCITDVIFERETGEVLAYQFEEAAGAGALYLPGHVLRHETAFELHFPAAAIALASADWLDLAGASGGEDPDEFTVIEEFRPDDG